MKKRVCVAMMISAVSLSAWSHDDDTLAFYAFKESSSGDSLAEKTILNAAEERFHGSVSITSGSIVYSDDAPGNYVFSSQASGAPVICERPQSVWFSGNAKVDDQHVEFPGLGTAVSSNDSFTVEFFFKYVESEPYCKFDSIPLLQMNCGLIYNQNQTKEPGLLGIMNHGADGRYIDGYIVDRQYHKARVDTFGEVWYGKCLNDGLWHHLAVVYTASNETFTVNLDYGTRKSSCAATPKAVLENLESMRIGNGGFRGLISCLRVSKCARSVETFLYASKLREFWPETVFHWSFDDADMIQSGFLDSPTSSDPRMGQFFAKRIPYDGVGRCNSIETASGVVMPFSTNAIPKSHRTVVVAGGERIAVSSNSVALAIVSNNNGGTDGTGLRIPGTNYFPVVGSFTMEGWFNLDYETWKATVVDPNLNVQRVALMGLNYGAYYNSSDFSLTAVHMSDGFRLKLCVYQKNKTYDPDGFKLDDVLMDGQWHHFAVTYDDTTWTFSAYVDGRQVLSYGLESRFEQRSSQPYREFLVGWGLSARHFSGLVDEVRLVRRVLSPTEFISFDRVFKPLAVILR